MITILQHTIRALYFLESWGVKIVLHIVPHDAVTLTLLEVNSTGLYAVLCIYSE